MRKFSNHPVSGKHGRPIVLDLAFQETGRPKPLVIFVHGYKGFKDWGVFGAMESEFLSAGFALLRFNFSHNGGTVEEPIDFPDLEAFGRTPTPSNWMMCNRSSTGFTSSTTSVGSGY